MFMKLHIKIGAGLYLFALILPTYLNCAQENPYTRAITGFDFQASGLHALELPSSRPNSPSSQQNSPAIPISLFSIDQSPTLNSDQSPSSMKAICSPNPILYQDFAALKKIAEKEREIDRLTAYLPAVAAIGIRKKLRQEYGLDQPMAASENKSSTVISSITSNASSPFYSPDQRMMKRLYSADNLSQGTPTPRPKDKEQTKQQVRQVQSKIDQEFYKNNRNAIFLTHGTIGVSYMAHILAKSAQYEPKRGFNMQEIRFGALGSAINSALPTICTMVTGATVCHLLRNYFCYQQDVIIAGISKDLKDLRKEIDGLQATHASVKKSNEILDTTLHKKMFPAVFNLQKQIAFFAQQSRPKSPSESSEDYGTLEKDENDDLGAMIQAAQRDYDRLKQGRQKQTYGSWFLSWFGTKKL
jgi:hypothetical protein